MHEAVVQLLRRRAASALDACSPGYPVWCDGSGRWQTGDGAHWAAGFATGMCDGRAVEIPTGTEIGGFQAFTGWYGRAAGVAEALADRVSVWGAIPVVESDLQADDARLALAYLDSVGPAACLLARVDPELAARHAHWTLQALQRPDGSVAQIVEYDRATGLVHRTVTGRQGLGPDSCWTRAQAWGLLAVAMAAPFTAGTEWDVGAQGRRLAHRWLEQVDPDRLPRWDLDAASGPVDSSAAAIAAAALALLAVHEPAPDRRRYLAHARRLVATLLRNTDADGALLHGCYDRSRFLAVDHELVWGDAYLLQAVQTLDGC